MRAATLVTWLSTLVAVTLTPAIASTDDTASESSGLCAICGERGTADAILNVLMFVPLGVALGPRSRPVLAATLAGLAVSGSIEMLQTLVPGRYPTLGDLIWNATGAGLGARFRNVLFARPPAIAARVAAAVAGAGLALGGWLLDHSPTRGPYYGQWTADLGGEAYDGRLLSVRIDDVPIPNARIPDSSIGRRLTDDWTLRVEMVAGTPPRELVPVFSIYDAGPSEILFLGTRGADVVLRERTRATALRLDQPSLRLDGALSGWSPGDVVTMGARRSGHERCLAIDSTETCGLGLPPGRTWSLLLHSEGLAERSIRIIDSVWLFGLLLALGWLCATGAQAIANGAVFAMFGTAAVLLTRLVVPPWWEIASAVAGLWVGQAGRRSLGTRWQESFGHE